MSTVYTSYKGRNYTLESNPIHQGGEGAIYKVAGSNEKLVAKIYHTEKKATEFHQKILFMVNNPPFGQAPQQIKEAIVWPLDLLFKNGKFVGYVMPMVDNGISLFMLTLPGLPKQKSNSNWQKFDKSSPDAFIIRLKVCYNLAMAVDLLHKSGKYVLVDMKPENILMKPNGTFSIIDLDSIQIKDQNSLLFRATAFTPEYAPPELHKKQIHFSTDIVPESFDCFSFAVILYQVFLSIHPFQASHNSFTTIDENISNSLFVHGSKKNQLLTIPPVHGTFTKLPAGLQKLFIRALDHGSLNPSFRPTAEEWAKAFLTEIKSASNTSKTIFNNGNLNGKQPGNINNTAKNNAAANNVKVKPKNITQTHSPKPAFQFASNANKGFNNTSYGRNVLNIAQSNNNFKYKIYKTLPFLKKAAVIVLIVFVGYIAWGLATRMTSGGNIGKSENVNEHLPGKYFGYIDRTGKQQQVAYLKIKEMETDKNRLAIQVIGSIQEESVFDELKVDNENNTIESNILGEGLFAKKRNGKITLFSTDKNSISWYFEK